jgi:hypothetical protein
MLIEAHCPGSALPEELLTLVAGRPRFGEHGSMATSERQIDSTESTSVEGSGPRQRLVAFGLAMLGLGLVAAGVTAVFATESDTGAAALLTVGALILLFVALGDRLESLRYGDLELGLRRKADEEASRGDLETAKVLERAADIVGQRRLRVARSYKTVRGSMPPGPDRTAKMESIIAEARNDAHALDIDDDEVLSLLWTGSEGARVWALGVLQARPELATTRAVLEAVERPDQMFDQYHALVLAERFGSLPTTRTWARERIADAVRTHLESGALGNDRDSLGVAKRMLEQASPS